MISEEIVQRVKEQNDIVDVISESVKLKRSGRYYTGLCPFHHEKTPSFTVTPDKQIYKCFGCGEAGNVITFVMKNRNISYTEAIELLAERANIDIHYNNETENLERNINEKYFKLNREAARFFYINLQRNSKALAYLSNRGVGKETIRDFGLGYSLDNWNALMNYLKKKGYTELDLLNCGLVVKSPKGTYYDRFRNRIMFPIFDVRSKIIGFGGRVMDDSKPKYLNSPETKVFKKGINLYGLNHAIKDNRSRVLIIVEGYMDCISLQQHGINNVVASLGTALTPYMAKLLKKYADRVIMSYDADNAGINATIRGLDILRNEGLDVRILTVPEGKDPDEYIRKNSKEAFLKLASEALSLIDYKLLRVKGSSDMSNSNGIYDYIKNSVEIVSELNSVERDIYINKISSETGVKERAIYDLLGNKIEKNVNNYNTMNTENTFGQKLYLEPAYLSAERNLLGIMLKNADAYDFIVANINSQELLLESHRKIFDTICAAFKQDVNEKSKYIELKCDDVESSREWVIISDINIIYDETSYKEYIDACIKEIRKYQLEESKKQIMDKIKQLEAQGKIIESLGFTEKLIKIQKEIGGM